MFKSTYLTNFAVLDRVSKNRSKIRKSTFNFISNMLLIAAVLVCGLVALAQSTVIPATILSWTFWFYGLISKSIYLVLVALIGFCYIASRKVKRKDSIPETTVENLRANRCDNISTLFPDHQDPFAIDSLADKVPSPEAASTILLETEKRNEVLKSELEELNAIRLQLEERSGVLEKERAGLEDKVQEVKLERSLETEKLKKEITLCKRNILQAVEEKEMLSKEMEVWERERRLTDCALRDQALLTESLEKARKEAEDLSRSMEALKQERDRAIAVAADLAARCQGDSTQIISQFISSLTEKDRSRHKKKMEGRGLAADTIASGTEVTSYKAIHSEAGETESKIRSISDSPAFKNLLGPAD